MYERYTSAKTIAASTSDIEAHDAVLLTFKSDGATQLITYNDTAVRGTNGRVIPGVAGDYDNTGKTGATITIDGKTGDQAQMILPIQIKSTGTLGGHEVHILKK